MIELHINTRDENGVKQPLDAKMAEAMGEAAKKLHEHYSKIPPPGATGFPRKCPKCGGVAYHKPIPSWQNRVKCLSCGGQ